MLNDVITTPHRPSRSMSSFCLPLFLLLFCVAPVFGHNPADRDVESISNFVDLSIWDDFVYVDCWIAVGELEALNFYPLIDADKDDSISIEEREAFLNQLEKDIANGGLRIVLDDQSDLHFSLYSSRMLLAESQKAPVPIKINFEFMLDLGQLKNLRQIGSQKQHSLTFYVTNTLSKEVFLKLFVAEGKGVDILYTPHQRANLLVFSNGLWLKTAESAGIFLNYVESEKKSATPSHFAVDPKTTDDIPKHRIVGFLKKEDLSLGALVLGLALAFLYGAGHALTPGHGKALVGAYLIGSRGTVYQAIFLAFVVTAAHLSSVIVAGILALTASHHINQTAFSVYLGVVSGLIIVILGVCLFVRRLTHPPDEHHRHHEHTPPKAFGEHHHEHHNHEHDYSHHKDENRGLEQVRLRDLIVLGISGGLVPCPAAIVVLLTAVTLKRTIWGLFLLLAFSLGLATVLMVIGILMVAGSSLLKPSRRVLGINIGEGIRIISIISPVLITFIGLVIIVGILVNSGVIIINWAALP